MYRKKNSAQRLQRRVFPEARAIALIFTTLALVVPDTAAQSRIEAGVREKIASPSLVPIQTVPDLKTIFEAAWSLQPEAQSFSVRQEAGAARREAAASWTAEPAALELLSKTDRLNRNQGDREQEVGIALPLWLPGERSRNIGLAEAEERGLITRIALARLKTAAAVRESYWGWQRAQIDFLLAGDRLTSAKELTEDVAKRVRVGDLARADLNQAAGNLAAAEIAVAEKHSLLVTARQQIRALAGAVFGIDGVAGTGKAEFMPPLPERSRVADTTHPEIADLSAKAEIANYAVSLAQIQSRANPELTISTGRERGDFADPYQQTVTIGVRIPFGSAPRHRAKLATARADVLESESQSRLAQERLRAELESVRQRTDSMRLISEAADRRAQLARETRGFFEKSFRLGETDLPSRLRVEFEAVEAERQARLAGIEHRAAISALRQALGFLPE